MPSVLNTTQMPFPPFNIWTSARALIGASAELGGFGFFQPGREQFVSLDGAVSVYLATGETDSNACEEMIRDYNAARTNGFWPYGAAIKIAQMLSLSYDKPLVRIRAEGIYQHATRFGTTLEICQRWFIRERVDAVITHRIATYDSPVEDVIDAAYAAASTHDWATALSILKTPPGSVTYAEVMRWLDRRRAGGYL